MDKPSELQTCNLCPEETASKDEMQIHKLVDHTQPQKLDKKRGKIETPSVLSLPIEPMEVTDVEEVTAVVDVTKGA